MSKKMDCCVPCSLHLWVCRSKGGAILEILWGLGQKLIGKGGNRQRKIWERRSRKNSTRRLIGGLSNTIFLLEDFRRIRKIVCSQSCCFENPEAYASVSWKNCNTIMLLAHNGHRHMSSPPVLCFVWSWVCWAQVTANPITNTDCITGSTPAFPQWLWQGSVTFATAVCPLPLPSFSVMAPLI